MKKRAWPTSPIPSHIVEDVIAVSPEEHFFRGVVGRQPAALQPRGPGEIDGADQRPVPEAVFRPPVYPGPVSNLDMPKLTPPPKQTVAPWVVRVEVKDKLGRVAGRDFLEVVGDNEPSEGATASR